MFLMRIYFCSEVKKNIIRLLIRFSIWYRHDDLTIILYSFIYYIFLYSLP